MELCNDGTLVPQEKQLIDREKVRERLGTASSRIAENEAYLKAVAHPRGLPDHEVPRSDRPPFNIEQGGNDV